LFQLLNYFFRGSFQGIKTDWTLLAGLDHSAQQLLSIEWLMASIPLDHPQIATLDFFVGREPMLAGKALATTTNSRSGLRRTGIDNLVFKVSAFWATHGKI
jgi:hypothetical protein